MWKKNIMFIYIEICKKCGTKYQFQASGNNPPKYNDHEYCPQCMERKEYTLIKKIYQWCFGKYNKSN